MKAKAYLRVCELIDQASPRGRGKREQYSDALIVKVYFWAAHWNQPVCWACDEGNWVPAALSAVTCRLPSQSRMSVRLRTVGVLQLVERVQAMLAEALCAGEVEKAIDSKPLKVGAYSKDRDAKRGRAAGEMARGYKLHAVCRGQAFVHWTLTGMNVNDQVPAAELLPKLGGWGYVAADNGYDANPVYRAAREGGHQLVAPPRKANAEVRDTRRNTADRIRSLDMHANPLGRCGLGRSFGQMILGRRKQIERNFGNLVMDGMHAPPAWVRTPRRVALWVAAKLIQRMVRQMKIKGLMK